MFKKNFIAIAVLSVAVFGRANDGLAGDVDVKWRASANQTYDDNITYVHQNDTADFISAVTLGMLVGYQAARTRVEITTDITQQFFWDHDENHNTSEVLTARVMRDISKYDHIQVTDRFSHAYQPISFDQEFTRIEGRYGYYSNQFDISYIKDWSEQFSTRMGYGNDIDSTSRSDIPESLAHRLSLEGDFAFGSKSTIFAGYDFLNRKLDPGGSANINTLSGGLRKDLTGRLNFEGRAGVDFVDSYDSTSYVNPLWSITFTERMSEKETANLSFVRRYSTSPSTQDVFNSWRISGGVNRQLRKKLSGSLSAFFGRGEYVAFKIKDDLVGITSALSYEIRKDVRGSLSYTYSQSISNVDVREYKKNAISLGISTEF